MNLTDDAVLKFQKGSPVFIDDICAVYTATVGEIVDIGYSKFRQYLDLLTSNKPISNSDKKSDIQKALDELTDFQYILMIATLEPKIGALLKEGFMFFTHETEITISLDHGTIVIGPPEEGREMNEEQFYDFQHVLRRAYFIEVDGEEIVINKDDSEAVKRLKLQMRANREKVRLAKAKKAEREKTNIAFSDLLGTVTLNNCGLNMANIWDITYYAFQDQLKRMGWRDQFTINHQAAMAGAKIKKSQLKHWMRSIADTQKT